MRMVLQRVDSASVWVGEDRSGAIGRGLLVFLGVAADDTDDDLAWLVDRVPKTRIFEDADGRMNRSLADIDGEALVISQFTLYGNLKKGNRPSFNRAAPPEIAVPLYERFVDRLGERLGKPVPTGVFAADMRIEADNAGPVTLIVDSRQRDF